MAQKRKINKKWVSRILLLLLYVVAMIVAYLVWDAYFSDKNSDDGMNQGTLQTGEEWEEKVGVDEVEGEIIEKEKVQQYEGEDPNDNEELSGVITYAEPVGEELMIRVSIDQYLGDGECNLLLYRDGGLVYSDITSISNGVATASCDGFDVPLDALNSGRIDIMVELSSSGKSGLIQGEVDI